VEPALQSCSTQQKPSKTRGKPVFGSCQEGNPCDVATGNKYQQEVDYPATMPDGLSYIRYYNSDIYTPSNRLPSGWRDEFDRQLLFSEMAPIALVAPGSTREALVYRPDGKIITFTMNGSVATPTDPDTVESLTQVNSTTWAFTTADDTIETYQSTTYDSNPVIQLQSIRFRSGMTLTLGWNSNNTLQTVTDSFGGQISFTYNSSTGYVSTMTDLAGNVYTYTYNSSGYLAGVYYPGPTKGSITGAPYRQYLYSDGNNPGALTNIIDESGTTYATWTYDSSRRALSSAHGSGQDGYMFTYNSDGTTTVTEAGGGSRVYTFTLVNDVPKYTSIVQGSLNKSASYDSIGYPLTQVDRNGIQTNFQYDTRGLQDSRTEAYNTPQARTTTTEWNSSYHLPLLISVYAGNSATGTPIRTTSYTYDSAGHQLTRTVTDTTVTPTVSRTWTYTYNSVGRVLTARGPRTDVNSSTTYVYYQCTTGYKCGQVESATDALGHVTTYNTYDAHGQPLTITDPNGVVTTLTYDARSRLTSRQVGTETTSYTYYPTGLLQSVTLPDSSTLSYTYDSAHRLTKMTDGAGNYVSYTLDVMGNRTASSVYDPTNTLSRTHSWVFNTLNQLYQDIGSSGSSVTTYGYDANGNPTSIAAPLARTTGNQYDALNRLTQVTDPTSGLTQVSYDANDNLASVTDPITLQTTYTHNGFGDVSQQASPATGTTTNTYDSGGNLSTSTDARGAVANYTYDALNRMTSAAFRVGEVTDQTIEYTYDAGTNGVGRLTGASDSNHSLAWTYDTLGRVTGASQTVGGVTLSAGYSYTNGDLTTMTTPSGQTVTYSYTNHQIIGITVNGISLLSSVAYEPLGLPRGWTWGNSTTETRLHNTDGNPSQIAGPESTSFSYDEAYRIVGISDSTNSALSWTYGYDLLDRTNSASQSATSLSWSYDGDGNRQKQTGGAPGTGLLGASFTYDAQGRMTTATLGANSASYIYSATGQMIEKTATGSTTTRLVYDQSGQLLGEYTSGGSLIQETVWLGDLPVATLRPNGSGGVGIYYIHSDQLAAPRIITRPIDNTIMWRWDTDPYGTVAPNSNPQGQGTFIYNLRFPGQYYQAETNLNYNYFRDYDPQTGRYIESDPIGLAGGSYSTYSYANSNPISNFDQLGLASSMAQQMFPQPATATGGQACPNSDDKQHCEELLQIDTDTCNAITKRRGRSAGESCHSSATQRYAACLRGKPLPPLNTWNNQVPGPTPNPVPPTVPVIPLPSPVPILPMPPVIEPIPIPIFP